MTIARRQQVSLEHTPYYHCTTRCVRRAFLCGYDAASGRNFDHRKQWLEDRIAALSAIFAIDLLAYAVMSNHYHVVLGVDADRARHWSDEEVRQRWRKLFSVPAEVSPEWLAERRERLYSLSWYMRCINEPLARRANREDGCTGRFWEGRFSCQALLDEAALVKCMAYVDLNPIRAGIARTPESSLHTSIRARIRNRDAHLLPCAEAAGRRWPGIPLRKHEYLALVDWTGRRLRTGKRGRIPQNLPPILARAGLECDPWLAEMRHYGRWYYRAVGSVQALERYCRHLGQRWLKCNRPAVVLPV